VQAIRVGAFISQALNRSNNSRVGMAESAKRNMRRLRTFAKRDATLSSTQTTDNNDNSDRKDTASGGGDRLPEAPPVPLPQYRVETVYPEDRACV
jgi:hypothetical protein